MLNAKVVQVREIVARILDLNPADLDENSGIDVVPGWDSLRNLAIIMEIEDELNYRFSVEDMTAARTIGQIAERIP